LERLRLLMTEGERIAQIGSWEYIAATQETVWSAGERRIYGVDPAEPSLDYTAMLQRAIHPEDAELLDQSFHAALQAGAPFELEHRIVRPDGAVRVVRDLAYPSFDDTGQVRKYTGTTLDITESKEAEAQLQQTEARLLLATASGQIGLWYWDIVTDTFDLSALCLQHMAVPPGSAFNYPHFLAVLHSKDRDSADQAIQAALRDHHGYACEYRVAQPDGGYRWIQATGHGVYDEAGSPIGMMGVTQDITERKQTEVALYESKE
jgi:PAS domain-containing protein